MQRSSQARRGQAAMKTASDPALVRHFAGHAVYLAARAEKLKNAEASNGNTQIALPAPRYDRRAVVLVLEDDDGCREHARNILRAVGFEVICARNFHEAIHPVENGAKIDIALIDVRMPFGTPHGISFARVAQTHRPSLKVIFMSAHLRPEDLRLIDEDEIFLRKPFAPRQLIEVVTRASA